MKGGRTEMMKVEEAIIKFIIDYYGKTQFYPDYDEIVAGTEGQNQTYAVIW